MPRFKFKFEYKITLGYLVIGSLWIVFSDKALNYFFSEPQLVAHLQTYKGWFYVLVTAILLFMFLNRHLSRWRNAQKELEAKNMEIKLKSDEYYSLYEEYKSTSEELLDANNRIIESEQQFENLMENAPEAIFIEADGVFKYINKATLNLYGAKHKSDLLDKSILTIVPEDFKTLIERRMKDKAEILNNPVIRYKHKNLEGKEFDVEVSVLPIRFEGYDGRLVFVRDISHILKHVSDIQVKNEFIQTVLDNLPIGLALNKFNDGKTFYMNKKFEEIYGWPVSEITDITAFFEKVYPDKAYREQLVNRVMKDIESKDPLRMHWENIQVTHQDGSKHIINAVNIPLFSQNTMVSTVIDITDLKNTEKQLIAAKERAEQSDRLKTAFLNNVSHEFRTPLNGILGFADLLTREERTVQQRKKYAKMLEESGRQLLNVVNDTMEISKVQNKLVEINVESCNLKYLVGSIVENKRMGIDYRSIQLNWYVDKKLENNVIVTDKHKLGSCIEHILDNAIKFTKQGIINLNCTLNSNNVKLVVEDTGIGIANDLHDEMFEPFRQVETGITRNYGGSGIGLTLVKAYIELLGGTVQLDSELGKGTKVTLTIPVMSETTGNEVAMTPASEEDVNWAEKTILIAEDEYINFMYLKELLDELGVKTIYANNGAEAVEFCKNISKIDLVLMDLKMPEMDGYEAFQAIREINKTMPVIAQTSYSFDSDIVRINKTGFNGYLIKPIKKDDLIEKIKTYIK